MGFLDKLFKKKKNEDVPEAAPKAEPKAEPAPAPKAEQPKAAPAQQQRNENKQYVTQAPHHFFMFFLSEII